MPGACDKYRTDRKRLTNISDSHNTQGHIQTHEEKEDPWRRVSLTQLYNKETGVMPTSCKVHTARVKFKSRIRYGKLTSAKEASLDREQAILK